MTAEEAELEETPPQRRRRWGRAVLVLAGLLLAMFGIAWLQRIQIAEGFVARELAKRGVPARYIVRDIGFFRQRLENVSLGDPARPDLEAEWVDVDTGFTLNGPVVLGVRAGPVRMRGRLANGRLSLGAVDRLLPPPSGKPVTLPRLHVDLEDVRMALETPYGPVALGLKGHGRLDNGFAGQLTAGAAKLELGGCTVRSLRANVGIAIRDARPTLGGPARARTVACGETLAWEPSVELAVSLDAALTQWRGRAQIGLGSLQVPQAVAEDVAGSISFEGNAARTFGSVDLAAGEIGTDQARAQRPRVAGRYDLASAGLKFDGTVSSPSAALAPHLRAAVARMGASGAGTPVGPLIAQFARAAEAASRGGRLEAALAVDFKDGAGSARIARASFDAASGARLALDGGDGVALDWPRGGTRLHGTLTTRGGGLPEAAIQLSQARPGAPVLGTALVQPYAAGGARIALTTVRFTAGGGGVTRVSTQATLSGPLADGRIDALVAPIDARWRGSELLVNPGCVPVAFAGLRVANLVLDRSRHMVCPTGAALLTLRDGKVSGGARVSELRLGGSIGDSPMVVTAATASFDFARRDFALANVRAQIGDDSVTRFEVTRLDGQVAGRGMAGSFSEANGQIGEVPLLLSKGVGRWDFADGRLALEGALRVTDKAEVPRFNALASNDARLTLADNRIAATATLRGPISGVRVADVTLSHDLSARSGSAVLDVPGLSFMEHGLQPSDVTPLTFGVIASVHGTVSGQGRFRWNEAGVTSDGVFRTTRADLAAAFGPVTGLVTEVRFTDLLNMETAPGQEATVVELNPGVPVENGVVRYRMLGPQLVQIESGRWPFAGGLLELEPTLLDFRERKERRMTFRLTGVDAAQFVQEMEFSNLNVTGTFDGVLPMVFNERGGRIEGGQLHARDGGSIAYIGEVTQRDLGFWGNYAFQALKSLNYRSLEMTMNGSLAGDMVTQISFAGVTQGAGAKSNFVTRRLQRLPIVFNVRINAPFRQLLDSVQSYYDPSRLIERNLPALLEEQERRKAEAIQRSESETKP